MLAAFLLFTPQAAAAPITKDPPATWKVALEAPNSLRSTFQGTNPDEPGADIEALARRIGAEYDLDWTFVETMRRESMNFTNLGQSRIPANGPNGREDSWGICQIHLPSHPDITKTQAMDPEWCLRWSAQQFKNGDAWMWTEWRNLQ